MPSDLSVVLVNRPNEITRLLDLVEAFTQAQGVEADAAYAMALCLDEMVANSIRHAYGPEGERHIWVELVADGDRIRARVEDEGPPFNPLEAGPPNLDAPIDERRVGGLGIFIVRTMMDTLEYARVGDRNVVTLEKLYQGDVPR